MRENRGRRRPPTWVVVIAAVAVTVAYLRRGVPTTLVDGERSDGRVAPVESLAACLREVADGAPGQATRQQIERLLASGPGRAELVAACIDHRDRMTVRHPALAERLRAALGSVGVEELVADGEAFDPERHRSVDVEHVGDLGLHDRVAQTCRPGYRDGATVLRPPEVVVHVYMPGPGPDQ